jgi:hypothetical protein
MIKERKTKKVHRVKKTRTSKRTKNRRSKTRRSRKTKNRRSKNRRSKTRRSRKTKTRRSRSRKTKTRKTKTRKTKTRRTNRRSRRSVKSVKTITKVINTLQDKLLVDINPKDNEGLEEIKDIVKEKEQYIYDRKFKNKSTALEDINNLTIKLKNVMYDKTMEISSGLKKILSIFGSNKTIKVLSGLIILLILIISTYKSVDYTKIKPNLIKIIDKLIDILMLFVPEEFFDDMVEFINTGTTNVINASKDLVINTTSYLGTALVSIAGKSMVVVVPILFETTVNILLTMMQQGATGAASMVVVTIFLLRSLRNMLV